ncbi:GNAT family N-acetyltransferase [Aquamicrobium sp. LC103]|uniref:GNAT family N-acetyltransferase n=1 Tax=Aquamicrobium sp. LC103 TaxID=1120658 RepID=UPI00063EAE38|nr:GNAT family N-acetyltransferase [Aquamicrobium sp. LC103]TKT76955.1 GNAT family N-acetyltransferase [Aquamicrobium sp. LC103]
MNKAGHEGASAGESEFVIRVSPSLDAFSRNEWESLRGASRRQSDFSYNPFISYDFLKTLEDSGCTGRGAGWLGQHLRLEGPGGALIGAVPCYLKTHSQGEYVFDHGWADAFERAGGSYYPKLQVSVPFTPATGPRLLTGRTGDAAAVRAALAEGLKALNERLGTSSVHVTFAEAEEIRSLEAAGFLHRTDQQFHFGNPGYSCYDDFLSTLASRKRKALKKERREALADGIGIDWLTGSDLTEAVWDDFFAFYMDTGGRKWGRPYLNREFFSLIGERMKDDILLVMARRAGRYVAGAINFIGSDTLYGRNWGCIEDHPYLHFEVCYHQAIDFAISRGLRTVEAGAQGEHKLARGYMPVTTHSAHFIAHPGLRRAVADYLERERRDIEAVGDYLEEHGPFRKDRPAMASDE